MRTKGVNCLNVDDSEHLTNHPDPGPVFLLISDLQIKYTLYFYTLGEDDTRQLVPLHAKDIQQSIKHV